MNRRTLEAALAAGAMAALWMGLTWLGNFTTSNAAGFAAIYLPIGFAVGLMWRFPRLRWAFAVGVFIGALALVPFADASWARGVLSGAANTIEAVATAWLLRRFGTCMRHPADALAFLAAAAGGAAVGGTLGALTSWLLASRDPLEAAVTWFAADLVGIMIVAPPVYLVDRESMRWRKAISSVILLAFATYCTVLAADFSIQGGNRWLAIVWFPVLAAVLFIGLRFGITLLGFVQLPAVIAGFATLGEATPGNLIGRQATAVLITYTMQWAVLWVGQVLLQRDIASGVADALFTHSTTPTATVVRVDGRWIVADANHALAQVLGIDGARLAGSDVRALFTPATSAEIAGALSAHLDAFECIAHPVGDGGELRVRGQWVRAEHGHQQSDRCVLFFEDIAAKAESAN